METMFSDCTSINNSWSSFHSSMVKQKLELTFWNGVFLGALVMFLGCSGIVETFFVSKEVFKLPSIYIDGKIYKLCRYK